MTTLPLVWGATEEEARRRYPADDAVDGPFVAMTRAIDVAAPVETTWRWLCQLAIAPYSYDWIDNGFRRSPRELTPGADDLVLGQRMAKVFVLTSFDAPHQWTGLTTPRGQKLFGPVAMTYAVLPFETVAERPPQGPPFETVAERPPQGPPFETVAERPPQGPPGRGGSRIVCRIAAGASGRLTTARAHALAWGDLVMIRKQLHLLKSLAEG